MWLSFFSLGLVLFNIIIGVSGILNGSAWWSVAINFLGAGFLLLTVHRPKLPFFPTPSEKAAYSVWGPILNDEHVTNFLSNHLQNYGLSSVNKQHLLPNKHHVILPSIIEHPTPECRYVFMDVWSKSGARTIGRVRRGSQGDYMIQGHFSKLI